MQKINSLKPYGKIPGIFIVTIMIIGLFLPYVSDFIVRAESVREAEGWVVTAIEKSVIGEGFYLEPVKIPVYKDDTFETFMDRVMETAAKEKDSDYSGNGHEEYTYIVDSSNTYSLNKIAGADQGNPVISESVKTILSVNNEKEILTTPIFEEANARRKKNDHALIGYTLSSGMYTAASQWRMTIDAGLVDTIKNIQFKDGSVLRIRFSLTEDGRDLNMTKDADPVIDEILGMIADMKFRGITADEKKQGAVSKTLNSLNKADLSKEEAEKIRDQLIEDTQKEAEEKKENENVELLSSAIPETENAGSTGLWPALMTNTAVLTTVSSGEDEIAQMIDAVAKTRLAAFEVTDPIIGTFGGDWTIMTLARSNMGNSLLYNLYYQAAVQTMQDKEGVLDKNKYSEYSRLILGLTSVGKDVTNVGGYNLLEYMTDFVKVKKQGLNGPIWALIALDSHDYEIPQGVEGVTEENYNSRERMVNYILERQKADGGWNLSDSETVSDPDMTGMAMVSLYRYAKANLSKGVSSELAAKVSDALEKGLNSLSAMQTDTGDFVSYGSNNAESTVWAYMGMCCMKVDPLTDARFIKNGRTVLDAIKKYYIEDETYGCGFQHVMDGGWNDMATDQAHYALVAYKRYEKNENFFFDMNDVEIGETKIKSISLDPTAGYFQLNNPQTVELKVTVQPSDAVVKSIIWESSDTGQAEVDENGKVTIHLTKNAELEPVVTITCHVTGADGTIWSDYYEIYSGMTESGVAKYIEENLPESSQFKADDMDALIFATKAYEELSDEEKETVSQEAKDALTLCQKAASKINHQTLTSLPNALSDEKVTYSRLIQIEGLNSENALPWQVQVQAKSVDSSLQTQMQAIIGKKTLMQAVDIDLVDLLTGEKYELPSETKIKVTMDVPYSLASNTESAEVFHFTKKTEGGFESEILESALSLDRQQVIFETASFSCFAYVLKNKETGVSNHSGTDIQASDRQIQNSVGRSVSRGAGSSRAGGNTDASQDKKTMLEMSGLTIGQSDIKMVNITGQGGLKKAWITVENTAAKVWSKLKVWFLPFATGCLVTGIAWIFQVCISQDAEGRKVKRVYKNIKKRNKK